MTCPICVWSALVSVDACSMMVTTAAQWLAGWRQKAGGAKNVAVWRCASMG